MTEPATGAAPAGLAWQDYLPGDRHLDGNTLLGPLGMLFVPDLAYAGGHCGSCGHQGLLAEAPLYADAPGLVLRCTVCTQPTLRLVTAADRFRLDLPHGSGLTIPHGGLTG